MQITIEQAERIVAALDPADAGYATVAELVRSRASRSAPQPEPQSAEPSPAFVEIWEHVTALRAAVAGGYVKPGLAEETAMVLADEIDRLRAQVSHAGATHIAQVLDVVCNVSTCERSMCMQTGVCERATMMVEAGATLKGSEVDHVECTDCGRYFRCDCGCSKPEIHYVAASPEAPHD